MNKNIVILILIIILFTIYFIEIFTYFNGQNYTNNKTIQVNKMHSMLYIFHKLCDNKGATITIATLQDGRYIGAYSPVSWGQVNGQYINNPDTFLFDNDKKYTTSESVWGPNNYAIYQNSSNGPTFGGGHDFQTLTSWSPQQFYNNAWTYLNNNRGPLGVGRQTYNSYQLKNIHLLLFLQQIFYHQLIFQA